MFEKLRFGRRTEKADGLTERERQVFDRLDKYLVGHEFTLFAQTVANSNPQGEKDYVDFHNKFNLYPKVENTLREILRSNDVAGLESFMRTFTENLYGIGGELTKEQQDQLKAIPEEISDGLSTEMHEAIKRIANERKEREEERKKNDKGDDWTFDMTNTMIRNSNQ